MTFLVDVNWARGHLMREYTVLLDPPVYTPGEAREQRGPGCCADRRRRRRPGPRPHPVPPPRRSIAPRPPHRRQAAPRRAPAPRRARPAAGSSYHVSQGDTLTKIARSLRAGSPVQVDQTMMAVYRANPDAFGGNINILRRGAVLRIPGADEIAALNQSEATSEVHRQMNAWREQRRRSPRRTPSLGNAERRRRSPAPASRTRPIRKPRRCKDRVKDLEAQLAASHRLIDIRNSELSALQRKLGVPPTAQAPAPTTTPAPPQTAAPAPTPAPQTAPPPTATAPTAGNAPGDPTHRIHPDRAAAIGREHIAACAGACACARQEEAGRGSSRIGILD